jgi:hypothetical protein
MKTQWTKEQAWEWYNARTWLRGCNFLPSDCCSRLEFLQELDFDKHLATAERELQLAASIGYNTIRVGIDMTVLTEDFDGLLKRFDRFAAIAEKCGISLLVFIGNDCVVPDDDNYVPPRLGPQQYDWGYHGGRKNTPHKNRPGVVGFNPYLDTPEAANRTFELVGAFISHFAHDPRIVIWDLFNEPGNSNRHEVSIPFLKRYFETARSADPDQPLTIGSWHYPFSETPQIQRLGWEYSDIISFHFYGSYQMMVELIADLKKFGRPILNTEWLHRIFHSNVQEMFPLFYLEKIGCWNWGLVAGKTQTYEPWEAMWQSYDAGNGEDMDFTKWQHDLFRPSYRPYDPKEIKIIKFFSEKADRDFLESK